jgi:thiosulfate dehydrogenase (quinone) large subunit
MRNSRPLVHLRPASAPEALKNICIGEAPRNIDRDDRRASAGKSAVAPVTPLVGDCQRTRVSSFANGGPSSMDAQPLLDRKLAYLMLRFTLGLSIFMHGLVRLPHLSAFADTTVRLFVETPLPAIIVRPFALSEVFVEAIIGLLLLLGLWTRWALLLGTLSMASLIFGTALRSDWNTLAIQMLYALIYVVLIAAREYNSYSVDALILRQRVL